MAVPRNRAVGMQFLSTLPARGATQAVQAAQAEAEFLSTLPARGATRPERRSKNTEIYFYPRSPRGERHGQRGHRHGGSRISIHAPREGSDWVEFGGRRKRMEFLSTLPARGATRRRVEYLYEICRFLSTLPARGATVYFSFATDHAIISIHAPREGSDRGSTSRAFFRRYFYPRSPRGERQIGHPGGQLGHLRHISIHAPREGSDAGLNDDIAGVGISIHAPREGSDSHLAGPDLLYGIFLSTLPARGAT